MIQLHAIQRPGPPTYTGWACVDKDVRWHHYTRLTPNATEIARHYYLRTGERERLLANPWVNLEGWRWIPILRPERTQRACRRPLPPLDQRERLASSQARPQEDAGWPERCVGCMTKLGIA